jgi:hypothetical protein
MTVLHPAPGRHSGAPCGHTDRRDLWSGLLARCTDCEVVITCSNVAFAYGEAYFKGTDGGGYDFAGPLAVAIDRARFVTELQRLEDDGLRGSVLDVGCATGGSTS